MFALEIEMAIIFKHRLIGRDPASVDAPASKGAVKSHVINWYVIFFSVKELSILTESI